MGAGDESICYLKRTGHHSRRGREEEYMNFQMSDDFFNEYANESDREHAKLVCGRVAESAAVVQKLNKYNLTLRDVEVLERMAKHFAAPDADSFIIFCEGFARGRMYEQDREKNQTENQG